MKNSTRYVVLVACLQGQDSRSQVSNVYRACSRDRFQSCFQFLPGGIHERNFFQ